MSILFFGWICQMWTLNWASITSFQGVFLYIFSIYFFISIISIIIIIVTDSVCITVKSASESRHCFHQLYT